MTEAICFEIETESNNSLSHPSHQAFTCFDLDKIDLLSKKGQNSQKYRSKAEKESTLRYFNSK